MAKMWEGRRFSLSAWKRSKKEKMCICSNFKSNVAISPFNRSCFYHGERQQK